MPLELRKFLEPATLLAWNGPSFNSLLILRSVYTSSGFDRRSALPAALFYDGFLPFNTVASRASRWCFCLFADPELERIGRGSSLVCQLKQGG